MAVFWNCDEWELDFNFLKQKQSLHVYFFIYLTNMSCFCIWSMIELFIALVGLENGQMEGECRQLLIHESLMLFAKLFH